MVLIPSHSFSFLRYAHGLWFFKFISDLATELAWWLMPTRFSSQENMRKYGWHMNTVPEVQEDLSPIQTLEYPFPLSSFLPYDAVRKISP